MTRDGKWVREANPKSREEHFEPGCVIGKLSTINVDKELIPVSMSGKVLAGPNKETTVDTLAQDLENRKRC